MATETCLCMRVTPKEVPTTRETGLGKGWMGKRKQILIEAALRRVAGTEMWKYGDTGAIDGQSPSLSERMPGSRSIESTQTQSHLSGVERENPNEVHASGK
jgi:hypothetical protein